MLGVNHGFVMLIDQSGTLDNDAVGAVTAFSFADEFYSYVYRIAGNDWFSESDFVPAKRGDRRVLIKLQFRLQALNDRKAE